MRPPKVTPAWVAGGWEIEQGHVPGAYRMLGIWALSGVTAVAVTNVGAWLGELHAGMYAGAGIGTFGILAGAAVYRRLERTFTLPESDRWSDGRPVPGRLADHLDDDAEDAPASLTWAEDDGALAEALAARWSVPVVEGTGIRAQEEYVLLAAELAHARGRR